jgi:hypothetical protein
LGFDERTAFTSLCGSSKDPLRYEDDVTRREGDIVGSPTRHIVDLNAIPTNLAADATTHDRLVPRSERRESTCEADGLNDGEPARHREGAGACDGAHDADSLRVVLSNEHGNLGVPKKLPPSQALRQQVRDARGLEPGHDDSTNERKVDAPILRDAIARSEVRLPEDTDVEHITRTQCRVIPGKHRGRLRESLTAAASEHPKREGCDDGETHEGLVARSGEDDQ